MIKELTIIQEQWSSILDRMKAENGISDIAYENWIKYFKPYKVVDNTLLITIDRADLYVNEAWFMKKYCTPLTKAVAEVMETDFKIEFLVLCED